MAAAPSSSPQPRRTALPLLLLLLSLLLILSVVVAGHAARVALAVEASPRSQEQYGDAVYEEKAMTSFAEGGERCGSAAAAGGGEEGEEAKEECLMRRTLVAHTDYIYTQGGGHN